MTIVGSAEVEISPQLSPAFSTQMTAELSKQIDVVAAENQATFDKLAEGANKAGASAAASFKEVATSAATMATETSASVDRTAGAYADAAGRMRLANGQFATSADKAAIAAKGMDGAVTKAGTAAGTAAVEQDRATAAAGRSATTFDRTTTAVGGMTAKLAGATAGIPILGSTFADLSKRMESATSSSGKFMAQLSAVGKLATIAAVAGVAIVGVESVKMAASFQSSSEHLVTDAGESQKALAGVQKAMLNVSAQTGTSASDIVNGMYHIESAGFHGAAGINLLTVAAEGAKVGGADLDTVSKTLTGTMNSLGDKGGTATQIMNELIETVASGDMRMQDLAASLGNVVPIAAKAGLSFAQIGGAIATMTAQNMSAQQATQDLRNTITNLQAPSLVAQKEMAQFGVNANDVSQQLGKKGLTGTLDDLTTTIAKNMGPAGDVILKTLNQSIGASKDMQVELGEMADKGDAALEKLAKQFAAGTISTGDYRKAIKDLPADQQALANGFVSTYNQANKFNSQLTSGNPAYQTFNQALSKMLGGTTGLQTALMLSGGSAAVFGTNVQHIQDAMDKSGKSVDNWNKIQGTFSQQMDIAKASVEKLAIELGMDLIPWLTKAAEVGGIGVQWLAKHKIAAEALAAVILGPLAVAMAVYIGGLLASAAAAWLAMAPYVLIGAAIAGLIYYIYELDTNWKKTTKTIEDVIQQHKLLAIAIGIAMAPIIITLATVTAVMAVVTHWNKILKDLTDYFDGVWAQTMKDVNRDLKDLQNAFQDVQKFLAGPWMTAVEGALAVFAPWVGLPLLIIAHWSTFQSVMSAIWGPMSAAARVAWTIVSTVATTAWSILRPVLTGIGTVISTVVVFWFDAMRDVVEAVFLVIGTAARLMWAILEPTFRGIYEIIRDVVIVEFDILSTIVQIAFVLIEDAALVFAELVKLAFQLIVLFIQDVLAPVFMWLWQNIAAPVFQGVSDAAQTMWNAVVHPIFQAIADFVQNVLGPVFLWLWHTIIQPVMDGIEAAVVFMWNVVVKPTLLDMKNLVENDIPNAFSTARDDIKKVMDGIQSDMTTVWAAIQAIFKAPINLLITGLNDLIDGVNDISGLVGNKTTIGKISPLASGGFITDGPALVGEGDPAHPEFVVASDPRYRDRNIQIAKMAAASVGLPMMEAGGAVGNLRSAIGTGNRGAASMAASILGLPQFAAGGAAAGLPNPVKAVEGAASAVVGAAQSAGGAVTGLAASAASFVGGLASTAASEIESGAADLVLQPIFDVVNALIGNVLPVVDPVKAIEAEITSWVKGSVTTQLQSMMGPTGGSGGYGSLTSWLGVPYLWGGGHGDSEAQARKLGVDCSGLVDQVFGVTGNTGTQIHLGSAVAGLSQSMPSDLVFFGALAPGEPHHVGVITQAGGGQMIDAPHTGTVVRYDNPGGFGQIDGIRRLSAMVTNGSAVPSGVPVGNHMAIIAAALAAAGIPATAANEAAMNIIITGESNWDPNAVGQGDINAREGHPSEGLAQTIPTTFEAYRVPGLPDDIFNPESNIAAAARYAVHRYGSLENVPGVVAVDRGGHYVGYDSGGVLPPGITQVYNGTGKPERVIAPDGAGSTGTSVVFGDVYMTFPGGTGGGSNMAELKAHVDQGYANLVKTVADMVDAK